MKTAYWLGAVIAATSAVPASAAQFTFDFATTSVIFGSPVSGSGVFTTSDTPMTIGGQTAFAVTSIAGTFNGSPITGPTLSSFGNYFTTGPTFVDGSGIRFNTSTTTNVTLFYDSNARSYRVNAINQGGSSLVRATSAAVGAVPEPTTWALMLVGFGAIGMAMRRRKVRAMVAFA
jgi:hypothetical protein